MNEKLGTAENLQGNQKPISVTDVYPCEEKWSHLVCISQKA